MFGGWGPHLRAIMRNSADELWLVTDAGPDVQHNEELIYHRFDGTAWSDVAKVKQISGIQQNVASVMSRDRIYSYGISIREPLYVEECIFDTAKHAIQSVGEIHINGKPLVLPGNCNYVGAAVGPSGRKVVWWTTVGVNGGEGKWSYIYEQNNSWVGPVVSSLHGYNDFGYVFASFLSKDRVAFAGQLFKGAYPKGTYAVGCVELQLGDQFNFGKNFYALDTNAPNSGRSAADIVVINGDTHVAAETQKGTLAYYFKPAMKSWAECDQPFCVLTNVHRARFLETAKKIFLITGSADGEALTVRSSKLHQRRAISWTQIPPVHIPVPRKEFAQPAAIYIESRSYQTEPVKALDFAIVGHYPELDSQILSVQSRPSAK